MGCQNTHVRIIESSSSISLCSYTGSGRVAFNNDRSYMKAVSAGFIEIKANKFSKKVQVDPYLDDHLCSQCAQVM